MVSRRCVPSNAANTNTKLASLRTNVPILSHSKKTTLSKGIKLEDNPTTRLGVGPSSAT